MGMNMPMGMFPGSMGMPGPMGIPGPVNFFSVWRDGTNRQGMGPYMPGLRPGLNGFGGPLGPVSARPAEQWLRY